MSIQRFTSSILCCLFAVLLLTVPPVAKASPITAAFGKRYDCFPLTYQGGGIDDPCGGMWSFEGNHAYGWATGYYGIFNVDNYTVWAEVVADCPYPVYVEQGAYAGLDGLHAYAIAWIELGMLGWAEIEVNQDGQVTTDVHEVNFFLAYYSGCNVYAGTSFIDTY